MNTNIIEIEIGKEQIKEAVTIAKGVLFDHIENDEQLEAVKENRTGLQKMRLEITRQCKDKRDDAIAYQKSVIQFEKDLIGEITPIEGELKRIEDEYKEKKAVEERRKILDDRMAEIERNKLIADPEMIVRMTSDQFNKWIIDERQRVLDEKQAELDKKENDQKLESRRLIMAGASKDIMAFYNPDLVLNYTDDEFTEFVNNCIAKVEKMEADAQAKANQEAQEKAEREAAQKKAKEDAEKQAKEREEKKLLKDKEYQDWLKINNYDPKTMIVVDNVGGGKSMYKFIAGFTPTV